MKISGKTTDIINKINDSSDKFIKNNYEVSILIEISFFSDKLDLFKELIFTSKYITGLKNILSSQEVTGKEFIDKTYEDFNTNLQKLFDKLKLIIDKEDQKTIGFFEIKYFKLNQESVNNILVLAEDLALCKKYMNRTPGIFDKL